MAKVKVKGRDYEVERCEECGIYGVGRHALTCKVQTPEEMLANYRKRLEDAGREILCWKARDKRLGELITFWNGKAEALRHENNKLRAQVRRQTPSVNADLLASCEAMHEALKRYEMDVEEDPPYPHNAMMKRARRAIQAAIEGPGHVEEGPTMRTTDEG